MHAYPTRLFLFVSILCSGFLFSVLVAHANTVSACPFTWTQNLKVGAVSPDVLKLQQFLNSDPSTQVASSGVGSSGMETTRLGTLTSAAVSKFQEKYAAEILTPNGLTKGTGFVGTATRAKLNALCAKIVVGATTIVSSSTPSQSTLTVAPGVQPQHSIAPANALYVPFTTVVFTAGASDVHVSRLVLERTGPGGDGAFFDLGLLDPSGVENTWGYLNNKHQVTLNWPFTVPAGTSQTYTIVGDMNADLSKNDGQMPILQLDSVVADAPVTGSFPISGTWQNVTNSLIIGSATTILGFDDPRGARTQYINDTNVKLSGIRITAGSQEDIKLGSINWNQTGSASLSDITNVVTVVNGVSYPAQTTDGRYYTSTFPNGGITIQKGNSLDVLAKADLTGSGSNRTVKFDLYYASDIGLTGQLYGFGISPVPGGNTAASGNDVFLTNDGTTAGTSLTPYFSGSVISIKNGSVTGVSKN